MKQNWILIAMLLYVIPCLAWEPVGDKIKTRWAKEVTPDNVWKEYPRPQLRRADWQNLNGLWQYTIIGKNEKAPKTYSGEILVPFCVESSLSGVGKTVRPEDKIWYKTTFEIPTDWKGENILLHFGAVDWETTVWVNGKQAGTHKGGFDAFSFDITKCLKGSGKQELVVSVWDPTDFGSQARGKQQLNQQGIWYTPVSGIWQTVWLEPVNKSHIASVTPVADIDHRSVTLKTAVSNTSKSDKLQISVKDGGKTILTKEMAYQPELTLNIPEPKLWTPATPHLYQLEMTLKRGNKTLDKVDSYFAMRKVSKARDEKGYMRICLNNEPIFQYGTLDQGWWPDGLHTPPTAEAMRWDMETLKEMGFNSLRKHIKMEPALYYYYADSLGIMIWQDMSSGMSSQNKAQEHVKPGAAKDWESRPAESAQEWESELKRMIDQLGFFPCITTWVVFNEGWGQYDTPRIVNWVMDYDKTRLINGVSGWADRGVGHFYDYHNYPAASMPLPKDCGERVSVLGEFGGLGLPLKEHLWNASMRNWGYKTINESNTLINDYTRLMYDLRTLAATGLSAAIYTQTTDVEGEVNGLITYDREVIKIPAPMLHAIHSELYNAKTSAVNNLIANARYGKTTHLFQYGSAPAQKVSFPVNIKQKTNVTSTEEFTLNKIPSNLMIWLNMSGNTTVWLNGHRVLDQNVRQTRQYNQFNLSDYIPYLKVGKNTLKVECDAQNDKLFDYGLQAID